MFPVILLLLLNAFTPVRGCSDYPSCGLNVKDTFTSGIAGGSCRCEADSCKAPDGTTDTSINIDIGPPSISDVECRKFCCERCETEEIGDDDYRRSLLQDESTNTTNNEDLNDAVSTSSDPVCFCYGVPKNNPINPCPTFAPENFDKCSDVCSSTCFVSDLVFDNAELEDCNVSPLFIDENNSIDENKAKNYIRGWQESGISGKVCVCEKKGFKISTNNIPSFQKTDCDEFCTQDDSFGGVRLWLTTDEVATSSPSFAPTSLRPSFAPTSSPIPTSNFSPVAFLASVVCIGFLMIALLFCLPKFRHGSS